MLVPVSQVGKMIIVLYRNEAGELYIAGEHDIDSQWLADLRVDCPNSCQKIVPRYVWEADEMQPEDLKVTHREKAFLKMIEKLEKN